MIETAEKLEILAVLEVAWKHSANRTTVFDKAFANFCIEVDKCCLYWKRSTLLSVVLENKKMIQTKLFLKLFSNIDQFCFHVNIESFINPSESRTLVLQLKEKIVEALNDLHQKLIEFVAKDAVHTSEVCVSSNDFHTQLTNQQSTLHGNETTKLITQLPEQLTICESLNTIDVSGSGSESHCTLREKVQLMYTILKTNLKMNNLIGTQPNCMLLILSNLTVCPCHLLGVVKNTKSPVKLLGGVHYLTAGKYNFV